MTGTTRKLSEPLVRWSGKPISGPVFLNRFAVARSACAPIWNPSAPE